MAGEDPRTLGYRVLLTVLFTGGVLWPLSEAHWWMSRTGRRHRILAPDDHDTPVGRSV
ncbi:hypothetical protein [Actinoplanes sp. NPDC049802]|uniref:hypothetical protein n=1 Tax=Actinoplanes sp. NPDC049802 TaxID=3154742 RepID=UPI0033CC40FB